MDCLPLTALIGPNGSGKSSFLRALEFFFTRGFPITIEDYYNRNPNTPISVTITFSALSPTESAEFGDYIREGLLTITKKADWNGDRAIESFQSTALQCPGFRATREITERRDRTNSYKAILESGEYPGLREGITRGDDVFDALVAWEAEHPERCERATVDFAGLPKTPTFIHVPAVRDAREDAVEGRSNPLKELLDVVVRRDLDGNEEFRKLKADVQDRYEEIVDETKIENLQTLADDLSKLLKAYAPESSVSLHWQGLKTIDIPLPTATATIVEDGFEGEVSRKGHGLQRSFILTLLQHLNEVRERAKATEIDDGVERRPDLILTIEEPELYQHPVRARHLAKVLENLAETDQEGQRVQVIYTTHSPFFVGIDRFDCVRLVRKISSNGEPATSRVRSASLANVAEELGSAKGADWTADSLRPRLVAVMGPATNEGFFADRVVLVEGISDYAALQAAASVKGVDFESTGIAVVPVNGKSSLDRPLVIFRQLGIPTFVLFDGDANLGTDKQHPETNRLLLQLLGETPADSPKTTVNERWACFENNLEDQIRAEIGGAQYDEVLMELTKKYGYGRNDDACKVPALVTELLERLNQEGRECPTLSAIVDAILGMKENETT